MKTMPDVIRALFLAAIVSVTTPALVVHAQQLLTKDNEKIDFAHGLLEASQYKLAVVQYEEFIQQFSQSTFLPDAYLGVGEGSFFLNDYEHAMNAYEKYVAQFPNGASKGLALLRWGQCLYLMGKYDQAFVTLNGINAVDLNPSFVQTLYFYLGQLRLIQGNTKEAIDYFEKTVQLPGPNAYTPNAYVQWGSVLAQGKDYAGALEKYAKAKEVAADDSTKAEILMHEGEAYFLSGQYTPAAEAFQKIVQGFPAQPLVKDATVNWLTALLKNKQFDELLARYNEQIKDNFDDPSLAPAHLAATEALVKTGKNEEAIVVLEKLMAATTVDETKKNKARLQKTELLMKAGKFAEVVNFVDGQTIADQDTKAVLTFSKGQSLHELKEYDKAWAVYQSMGQEFPDTPLAAQAYCGMAHVRHAQAQEGEAASLFMDCFNRSKDEAIRNDAVYSAFLTYQKFDTTKAIETAELYLKLYPQSEHLSDVIFLLAGRYSHEQKYEQAIDTLKALLSAPDEKYRQQALFKTAYNLQLAGKTGEALGIYEGIIAANLNPDLVYLALKNCILIYIKNKDEAKMAEALDHAVRAFDSNDLPMKDYLWLAEYWQIKNEPQKMLDVLTAARKYPASVSDALGIKFFTAQAYRLQNNCAATSPLYDEVLAAPEGVIYKGRAHLGRAMCVFSGGDPLSAQKELEQAIAENPEDNFVAMRARFEMARIAESQKDWDKAAKLYMVVAVLYKDPDYSPRALMAAGVIFEQLNNSVEAQNAYRELMQSYPESPLALKAKEIVEHIK